LVYVVFIVHLRNKIKKSLSWQERHNHNGMAALIFQKLRTRRTLPDLAPSVAMDRVAEVSTGRSLHLSG